MRKLTEFSAHLRAMARSKAGIYVQDQVLQGGSGEWVESALAVLAAAEARFMFLLVKLSECKSFTGGQDGEQATVHSSGPTLTGGHPGEEQAGSRTSPGGERQDRDGDVTNPLGTSAQEHRASESSIRGHQDGR